MQAIDKAKKELFGLLKGYKGISAVAARETESPPCLVVYTSNIKLAESVVPSSFDGFTVKIEERGIIRAM